MNVYPEEIADPEEPANPQLEKAGPDCRPSEFFRYESPRQAPGGNRFSEHCGR